MSKWYCKIKGEWWIMEGSKPERKVTNVKEKILAEKIGQIEDEEVRNEKV